MSPSLFLSPHPHQHTHLSSSSPSQSHSRSPSLSQQQRGPQSPVHKGMNTKTQTPYTPYLPSDFSYFSPLAPESASLPPSAIPSLSSLSSHPSQSPAQKQTHSQSYTYTSQPSSQASSSSSSGSDSSGPNGTPYPVITATITSRSPPPTQQEMLAQFALHFPSPPALRLPSSSSSSNSSITQPSPCSPTSPSRRVPPSPSSCQTPSFAQPPSHPRISPSVPQVSSLPSPMDRSRRTGVTPVMTSQTTQAKHTLSVMLPKSIAPEMVTVSANKGDRLKVVADAWHMEDDCHYEWIISFQSQDADMSSVQAKFDPDGRLTIDVKRRIRYGFSGGPVGGGVGGGRLGVGYFARA